MIEVSAGIAPLKDGFAHALAACVAYIDATNRHPSCLVASLYTDGRDITLTERWATADDFERHKDGPHAKQLRQAIQSDSAEPLTFQAPA